MEEGEGDERKRWNIRVGRKRGGRYKVEREKGDGKDEGEEREIEM